MGNAAAPSCLSAEVGRLAGRFRGHLQMAEERWESEALGPGPSSEREPPDIVLGDVGSANILAWPLPIPFPALPLPTSFWKMSLWENERQFLEHQSRWCPPGSQTGQLPPPKVTRRLNVLSSVQVPSLSPDHLQLQRRSHWASRR